MHFSHTVVRVRAPEVADRYGNRVRDWADAARLTWSGVNVQPAGSPPASNEDDVDRQTTVTGWRLYTPPWRDVDLAETDRIEFDDMVLEVDGKVGRWRLDGRVHHIEADLKEID